MIAQTARVSALVVAGLMAAAACAPGASTPSTRGADDSAGPVASDAAGASDVDATALHAGGDEGVAGVGLRRFDGCDALLDYLRAEYSSRVSAAGFSYGGWESGPPGPDDEQSGPAAIAPTVAVDYSATNTQEPRVDEPDIIKTDGSRIFTLSSSGHLVVVDVSGRRVVGSVDVDVSGGWPVGMFVYGDSLLLVSGAFSETGGGADTVLHRIDLRNDAPEVVERIHIQGEYAGATSVDGTARVVIYYNGLWNRRFDYSQNSADEVRSSTLDDWLPHFNASGTDSSEGPRLTPCENTYAPAVFGGVGVTTLLSVPIDGAFDPGATTAVAGGYVSVYASAGGLYLATALWIDSDGFSDSDWAQAWRQRRTSIHRFDATDPAYPAYTASGEVPGTLGGRFSLSEHSGHLRAVTTTGSDWGDDLSSQVRVLRQHDDRLIEVGRVDDLGRGQQVRSVRFAGGAGYMVTAEHDDPFYTIDLSDPAAPAVPGELEIPGFFHYLHIIGDGMVLGVGSDIDDDGYPTATRAALFDVSDPAAPRQTSVWTAPDGWSAMQRGDYGALLWWAPLGVAVMPVTVGEDWSGAVVLQVADGALAERGRIDHAAEAAEPGLTACRPITAEDLPADSGDEDEYLAELRAVVSKPDGPLLAMACEPGEEGVSGYNCDDDWHLATKDSILDLLEPAEALWLCGPDVSLHRIARSVVIGQELWTLSFKESWPGARLHVNDIVTLERLAALEL